MLKRFINSQLLVVGLLLGFALCAQAQVEDQRTAPPAQVAPQAQSFDVAAPQVVTVVHRLNGMKLLSLLHSGGQSPKVVGDEFLTTRELLTSVTAGFDLGDGKSVMARLPQSEFVFNFYWSTPSAPAAPPVPAGQGSAPATPAPSAPTASGAVPLPDLLVIQRDGKSLAARYVGLDVGTGLSLIQIDNLNAAPQRDAPEAKLAMGQRVRLLAPRRTNATASTRQSPAASSGKLYLAVGEIEGQITELKRSSNGKLAQLIIRAPKLTGAFAGGIALNNAGETIGIVESSKSDEARVLPMALVRRAAERVLARQGNVPQPWLGVRGQALAATPLAQLLSRGWSQEEAALLQSKRYGILLTAVAPNTPAAEANLRSGDVIVKLNEDVVKSAEDFSFMLNEVGSGATVNFTVLRGEQVKPAGSPPAAALPPTPTMLNVKPLVPIKPLVVSVKLKESWNAWRSIREAEFKTGYSFSTNPLSAAGVETIPLAPKAAARLGANGGLLVVYVGPETIAARSGLRVFDIIESANGHTLTSTNSTTYFGSNNVQQNTFVVVRDRKKFSVSFSTSETKKQ